MNSIIVIIRIKRNLILKKELKEELKEELKDMFKKYHKPPTPVPNE